VLLGVIGTLALWRPIGQVEGQTQAWIAWGVILITSAMTFRGNMFSAYLQGVNEIALLRRWEALTLLGAAATSILVLLLNGSLLALVIASESWVFVRVLRNWWLSRRVHGGRFKTFMGTQLVPQVFKAVWPAAWRSGLGVLMSRGLIEASGLVFAQLGSAAAVASYLIALRVIQTINLYSEAPFYTKLPILARLRAEGRLEQQGEVARKGMQYAFWTFTLGFIAVGVFAKSLLGLIRSNADFVSPLLWATMGLAFFIARYGAMHLQLYSTTNHIIWHIVTAVSGVAYILVSMVLLPYIGVYAFPIGIIVGYVGFHSWYAARHSYRAFALKFWPFEKSTSMIPFLVLLIYLILNLGLSNVRAVFQ
jgi:O-antigen/teichoic acid export membrane protein